MENKAYYILAVYNTDKEQWFLDYGAYDRTSVDWEVYTLIHSDWNVKRKHTKIIKCYDNKRSIDLAISALNKKES